MDGDFEVGDIGDGVGRGVGESLLEEAGDGVFPSEAFGHLLEALWVELGWVAWLFGKRKVFAVVVVGTRCLSVCFFLFLF